MAILPYTILVCFNLCSSKYSTDACFLVFVNLFPSQKSGKSSWVRYHLCGSPAFERFTQDADPKSEDDVILVSVRGATPAASAPVVDRGRSEF